MSFDQHTPGKEWATGFLSTWLDSDFRPSEDVIRQRHWSAVVVADYLNTMEAEWLADAITALEPKTLLGIGVEYKREPDVVVLAPTRNALMQFNGNNCWRYALITTLDEGFLCFKDEANRFYLLCGTAEFVAKAHKCSLDTARIMFFDYWVNLEHHNEQERQFLTRIWEKYSKHY